MPIESHATKSDRTKPLRRVGCKFIAAVGGRTIHFERTFTVHFQRTFHLSDDYDRHSNSQQSVLGEGLRQPVLWPRPIRTSKSWFQTTLRAMTRSRFYQSMDDSRLRVLRNREDIGAAENFAKCIRTARGDYLVLVSDDNFLEPLFLEKCARLIRLEPGLPIVLAVFDIVVLSEFHKNERRLVPGAISRKLSTGIWPGTEILKECLNGRITAAPLSVVVRTDILRCNNRFSSGYQCAGDTTWLSALLEGQAGLINERCAVFWYMVML